MQFHANRGGTPLPDELRSHPPRRGTAAQLEFKVESNLDGGTSRGRTLLVASLVRDAREQLLGLEQPMRVPLYMRPSQFDDTAVASAEGCQNFGVYCQPLAFSPMVRGNLERPGPDEIARLVIEFLHGEQESNHKVGILDTAPINEPIPLSPKLPLAREVGPESFVELGIFVAGVLIGPAAR